MCSGTKEDVLMCVVYTNLITVERVCVMYQAYNDHFSYSIIGLLILASLIGMSHTIRQCNDVLMNPESRKGLSLSHRIFRLLKSRNRCVTSLHGHSLYILITMTI